MELVKGQKVKLAELGAEGAGPKYDGSAACGAGNVVRVALRADACDVVCFGLDAEGRLSDDRYFVFYNNKASPEGAIAARGPASGDTEIFEIDLQRLPQKIRRLVFAITSDNVPMSSLGGGHFRIDDRAVYRFRGADFTTERAVIAGELYFKDVWRVSAVGQGFAGGLRALLESFGGTAADEPAGAAASASASTSASTSASAAASGGAVASKMRGIEAPRSTARASQFRSVTARTSGVSENVGGRVADVIDYTIFGDDMQMVEIELDPGEAVRAEVGAMMYMGDGIEMKTSMGGGGGLGGLLGGAKRILMGESFFITDFVHNGSGKAHVAFGAPYPGKIIPLELGQLGGTFLCQKDAFLCAAKGIDIEIAFTKKIGAGFFGGEGFILQKLKGDGRAFIHAGGAIVQRELKQGETLRVDTGCLVAFAPTVDYDIQFVGGFKNALFGGEGLFFAKLTGPGLVYLQSLPLARLADRLTSGMSRGREQGGLLGGLLGGH